MPTKLWKAATSWGMEVIGTRLAITAPATPPTATPPAIIARVTKSSAPCPHSVARVTPTARAMPIMP